MQYYERKRAKQVRRRAALDRENFDPSPPDDDTWTAPDELTDGLRKLRAPETLNDALRAFVAARGWSRQVQDVEVWRHWQDLVGEELAARCEPARIVNRTLTIRAESQVWATQLKYLVTPLRARCDEILGPGVVRSITVVVGPRSSSEG
ncbi:MAG: DUF721 domain-containing protein [Nitriliruptoraceae bacterium]